MLFRSVFQYNLLDYNHTTSTVLAKVTKTQLTNSKLKRLDNSLQHSTSTLFKDTDPNAPHIHLIDLTLKKLDNIRTQLTDSRLKNVITITSNTNSFLKNDRIPYHVFIPSFLGESIFILISPTSDFKMDHSIDSHITDTIWKSYQVFNW